MRQPAEAMPGRLAYKLVCCRMSRDGERSAKGGGGTRELGMGDMSVLYTGCQAAPL